MTTAFFKKLILGSGITGTDNGDDTITLAARVASVFGRTGSVVAAAGDYYGVVAAAATGATAASQYVGATASGAPASGTHAIGDYVVDRTGSFWVCTVAGTPGTWVQVYAGGGGPPSGAAGGTLGGTYPNPTVNTDGATLETNSNALRVKAGGIGANELASTAVTPATYGDSANVGQFTVDADGRITGAVAVAITSAGGLGADGWVDDTAETWTYASGSGGGLATFTIAGVDLTAKYTTGTRIKLTQTTVKYFVVTTSSFSTNTTVTVMAGTAYTLANAAISANYHSYVVNPQGYPTWFAFTPSPTGYSSGPTVSLARFAVNGQICIVDIAFFGPSNTTALTWTAPIKHANVGPIWNLSQIQSASTSAVGLIQFTINSTTVNCYATIGAGAFSAAGGTKAIECMLHYPIGP